MKKIWSIVILSITLTLFLVLPRPGQSEIKPSSNPTVSASYKSAKPADDRWHSQPLVKLSAEEQKIAFENYERFFRHDFNPFEKKFSQINGILKLDYKNFPIQFRLLMRAAKVGKNRVKAFPIYLERLQSYSAGISIEASEKHFMSMEEESIILHLYTPMVMDLLEVNENIEQNKKMREVLGEFSDILVPINHLAQKTTIRARRNLDSTEIPVPIGFFEYSIDAK